MEEIFANVGVNFFSIQRLRSPVREAFSYGIRHILSIKYDLMHPIRVVEQGNYHVRVYQVYSGEQHPMICISAVYSVENIRVSFIMKK